METSEKCQYGWGYCQANQRLSSLVSLASNTLKLSLAAGLTVLWAISQRVQVALSSGAACLPSCRWTCLDLSLCFSKGQSGWEDKGIRIPDTKELQFVLLTELNTFSLLASAYWLKTEFWDYAFLILCFVNLQGPWKPTGYGFYSLRCDLHDNNKKLTEQFI